ncbi:MAG: VIT1/CCC1 transporter family protein, partial [Deltaproteobacteria bacterium]|nr:VIT1/CCC1 transporter family protein [Deltaproteobacteria bacterium]
SMAAGEYTSVASQRDLLQRQVELERRELAETPGEEAAELALIFKLKGLSAEQAGRTTSEILKNPAAALDTLVREELGLDPADLGSPMRAALSSFVTFALGAVVPIVPFLFARGWMAVGLAGALAALVLTGVGALLGVLSGTGPVRSAARMVGLAGLAAAITFGLGRLVGRGLE